MNNDQSTLQLQLTLGSNPISLKKTEQLLGVVIYQTVRKLTVVAFPEKYIWTDGNGNELVKYYSSFILLHNRRHTGKKDPRGLWYIG